MKIGTAQWLIGTETGTNKGKDIRKAWDGRRVRYHLTPLGRAYVARGQPDDDLFARILRAWPPYAWLRTAIRQRGVAPDVVALAGYARAQYAPYAPYARCLFNPNKTDGLVKLYEIFG